MFVFACFTVWLRTQNHVVFPPLLSLANDTLYMSSTKHRPDNKKFLLEVGLIYYSHV